MWFLLAILGLAAIGIGDLLSPFNQPNVPVNADTTSACYALNESQQLTVDPDWLLQDDCKGIIDNRTYVLIRPNVRIVNGKIAAGQLAHPNNDCQDYSSGNLRKIGTLPTGEDIYWENKNFQQQDLTDFLFINIGKDDHYHYFDVYIDKTRVNDLPDFVVNCRETGGIVPVLEGPDATVFPPQFVPLVDIDHSDPSHDANFIKYTQFYKDYFVRIEEKPIPDAAEQIGIYKKTVASESHTYDVFFHAGILYLKDQADGKSYMYNPSDEVPDYGQQASRTLQLKEQKFISTAEWTWATPVCKPALYLYPEKPTELSIKVRPQGILTLSIPEHGDNGWQVIAYPGGIIKLLTSNLAQPASYPYLYYESAIKDFLPPKKGWVVARDNLSVFFDQILPKLGLNQKEIKEFKSYWVKVLNQQPYYFAGLVPREEIDRVEAIDFSVQPDTFIRVRLYFEPLLQPVSVEEPILPKVPKRQGFTAVDWGGFLAQGSCSSEGTFVVTSH